MSIGDKIKERRLQLGLSQEELAKRMGYKDRSTINKIEAGINDVTQSKVKQFAEVLGVSIAYLMEWDKVDYLIRTENGDVLIESKQANDVKKAIELYQQYLKLSPDKQAEFQSFLEYLQSKS